jgi:hypothetical protein
MHATRNSPPYLRIPQSIQVLCQLLALPCKGPTAGCLGGCSRTYGSSCSVPGARSFVTSCACAWFGLCCCSGFLAVIRPALGPSRACSILGSTFGTPLRWYEVVGLPAAAAAAVACCSCRPCVLPERPQDLAKALWLRVSVYGGIAFCCCLRLAFGLRCVPPPPVYCCSLLWLLL